MWLIDNITALNNLISLINVAWGYPNDYTQTYGTPVKCTEGYALYIMPEAVKFLTTEQKSNLIKTITMEEV